MEFREIIELAKKRGRQAGKVRTINMIAAFQSDRIYSRDDITFENNMEPDSTAEPLSKTDLMINKEGTAP